MKEKIIEATATVITRVTCTSIDGRNYGGRFSCPFENEQATPNAGYATDHFCIHTDIGRKKIMGYVEGARDMKPVPNWCPILIIKASNTN
jgi:hypothetical protein